MRLLGIVRVDKEPKACFIFVPFAQSSPALDVSLPFVDGDTLPTI